MSFLGMGTMEILIILLVAFIFLGPERMIESARTLGKWTAELRRMGSTVQAEMDDLTNAGAPLSSRYGDTQNSSRPDKDDPPLDQDHPVDASSSGQATDADSSGPVGFRRMSADAAQPGEGQSDGARKEESA